MPGRPDVRCVIPSNDYQDGTRQLYVDGKYFATAGGDNDYTVGEQTNSADFGVQLWVPSPETYNGTTQYFNGSIGVAGTIYAGNGRIQFHFEYDRTCEFQGYGQTGATVAATLDQAPSSVADPQMQALASSDLLLAGLGERQ